MRGLGRALGAALAVCTSGCSVLFMERLPESYDVRRSEPHCSTSMGFVIWDGAIAVLDVATVPLLLQSDSELSSTNETLLLATVMGDAVLHVISAAIGASWANECAEARQQRAAYSRAAPRVARPRAKPLRRRRAAGLPRGFYCASQSCAKEKASCEQFRIATGDPTECTLVESAFCFAVHDLGVCAPTPEACQRQRSVAGSAAESDCIPQGEAASGSPPQSPAPPPEPKPTGFHCRGEVCARERDECERQRASAGDAAECTPATSAYCFTVGGVPACRSSLAACQRSSRRPAPLRAVSAWCHTSWRPSAAEAELQPLASACSREGCLVYQHWSPTSLCAFWGCAAA